MYHLSELKIFQVLKSTLTGVLPSLRQSSGFHIRLRVQLLGRWAGAFAARLCRWVDCARLVCVADAACVRRVLPARAV